MENERKIKAWDITETILLILIVGFAVYCILGVYRQQTTGKMFYVFGYRPVVILSGSMEPELRTNSVVLVKKTKDVKTEDVIFFFNEEKLPVIHRYVGNDEHGSIITKGDANPKEDPEPISPGQVEGRVVLRMNWLSGIVGCFRRGTL